MKYIPDAAMDANRKEPTSSRRPEGAVRHVMILLAVTFLLAGAVAAFGQTCSFDSAGDTRLWATKGDVTVDPTRNHEGGLGGSLKVGPGGKAVWKLRDADGSGQVSLWVYDNQTKPSKPKEYRVGPRWGIIQSDGRVLVVGALYAPYLSGNTTYAASDSDQRHWFNVQYTAVRRIAGWHCWRFDFDAEEGLTISCDGKTLPVNRFDWNKTKIRAFNGVAVFGDETKGNAQTVWVDDVTVELGGSMKAAPAAPSPPPPVTPEKDPRVENPVRFAPEVRGRHPRLLFTSDDIPRMKVLAQGKGRMFFDDLMDYLPPSVPPKNTKYLTNATEAMRQGLWRAPTVGLHYVLTGNATSLERARGFLRAFMAQPHWDITSEKDSGMGAANIMVGAALLYDWLYHDLDPGFRDEARRKLILQARRMYYRGHLKKAGSSSSHYWQNDPQNNHRWHRDAGLALCVLAAADRPEDAWILTRTLEELEFVHKWLAKDGTSHESPSYMVFGGPHLVMAMDAADRCLGTRFLGHDFFKNAALFRMQTLAPGLEDSFHYGDSEGLGWITHYLWKCTSAHRQADLQAALLAFRQASPQAFSYGWFGLVWFDSSISGGSITELPDRHYFDDLGLVFARDGWTSDRVGLMFKCGPYGGHTLNAYRNRNDFHYINVAHDDPDANTFQLFTGGEMVVEEDRYSTKKPTSSHNTILVNGRGQKGEGKSWTQPLRGDDADMARLARMITWKSAGDVVIAEGEAGRAYADLDRFRRTVVWVEGSYILLLDDIRATREVELAWLIQSGEVIKVDHNGHRYRLQNGEAACDFELAADTPFVTEVVTSTADHRGKSMGLRQLQAKTKTARWRVAAVFDAWGRGDVSLAILPRDEEALTVTVTQDAFTDAWTWQAAPDSDTPSAIEGTRAGQFSVSVGPQDRAHIPHGE